MQKGFSLIELLVVIGIISILSAIAVPNFMAARERARDAARKSDLKAYQQALELFKQDQNPPTYPPAPASQSDANSYVGKCWTAGNAPSTPCVSSATVYLKKIPGDPSGTSASPRAYSYILNSPLDYTLCTCLENKGDADGISGNCSGTYTCSSGKKYELNAP